MAQGRFIPTSEEFVRGFRAIAPLHDNHLEMLRTHYRASHQTLTATQLALAVGYDGFRAVNLQYGLLAARLGEAMDLHGANLSLLVKFTAPGEDGNEHWELQLRPEVMLALETLGWV